MLHLVPGKTWKELRLLAAGVLTAYYLHFHSTARVPPIRKDVWPPFCVIKLVSQQASAQFDVAIAVMRHSFHLSIESAVQCGMKPDDHISRVPLV